MTHKVVTLDKRKKDGHESPYVRTDVPFSKSLSEVKALLERYGCTKILEYTDKSGGLTTYTIAFENMGKKFMIEFPITYLKPTGPRSPKTLNMNVSGRIIYNKVKALLIDVEIDYLDFSQAMVPFMLLPTASGRPTTATDILTLENAEARAESVQFLLGDGNS